MLLFLDVHAVMEKEKEKIGVGEFRFLFFSKRFALPL